MYVYIFFFLCLVVWCYIDQVESFIFFFVVLYVFLRFLWVFQDIVICNIINGWVIYLYSRCMCKICDKEINILEEGFNVMWIGILINLVYVDYFSGIFL